jgi:hypothetical protein
MLQIHHQAVNAGDGVRAALGDRREGEATSREFFFRLKII